jgi:hypothetical protein
VDFSEITDEPITMSRPLSRLLLALQLEEMRDLMPEQVGAHPAARAFPGAVPDGAARIDRTIEVNTATYGWHSTGLYAAPGEIVEIAGPAEIDGKGLRVRIGAHTDKTWHLTKWARAPEISRSFPLGAPSTRAANPFGGLIYIDVPKDCGLGVVSLAIRNAVAAPYYVLGETGLDEWRDSIRHRPAPWAELQGKRVILTLPSSAVREIDDPAAAMKFWDSVLDADADLAGMPCERSRLERICTDEQISAGYMHSGYPIMTHLDVLEMIVDPAAVMADKKGGAGWGFFHEIGHNHQSSDWTFSGTGEVTVNLFTLYVCETVCGTPIEETREQCSPEWMLEQTKIHLAGGADFQRWKSSPFLGLIMYIQLQRAFGWDAYKKVFAEYRDLPDDERPKTDDEKRDQWLVRLSRTVRRDLGPFFQTWGIPTSDEARESLSDLPIWMPEGFPPGVAPGETDPA